MTETVLLFLGRIGGFEGWIRLAGDAVIERGGAGDALPPLPRGTARIAITPGEEVTLHWLELPPGLATAQAAAAARLMAAELSAQPPGEMHVAVGRPERESESRCVGLVPAAAMTEWLERLGAAGFDPDYMVPETLLVAAPAGGVVRVERDGMSLYRGPTEAFALEAELAQAVLGDRPVETLDTAAFEAGLAGAVSPPLLDLRQGAFARRRQWQPERGRVRRLVLLGLAILLASLLIQLAAILRYTFAADAAEEQARSVATRALPRAGALGEPSADLRRRLAELRGGGVGYGAIAGAVFAAVKATPNVELSSLSFSQDGSLRATVSADAPATLGALAERIEDGGFVVDIARPRGSGGRQAAELTVRPR